MSSIIIKFSIIKIIINTTTIMMISSTFMTFIVARDASFNGTFSGLLTLLFLLFKKEIAW